MNVLHISTDQICERNTSNLSFMTLTCEINVLAFFLVMSSFSICRCMMCKMTHLTVNMHFWEDLCVIPASKKELKKCNDCTYNLIFTLRDCFQI